MRPPDMRELQDGVPVRSEGATQTLRGFQKYLSCQEPGTRVVQAIISLRDSSRGVYLSRGPADCRKYAEHMEPFADRPLHSAAFVVERPDGFTASFWFTPQEAGIATA